MLARKPFYFPGKNNILFLSIKVKKSNITCNKINVFKMGKILLKNSIKVQTPMKHVTK